MKYFINTPYTAETLKAEFRALCLTMHPDKGGNAEEFKAMQSEYDNILKTLTGTKGTTAATDEDAADIMATPLRGTKNKTFADLVARLVEVFSVPEMLTEYRTDGFLSESFGWDGGALSPLSRAEYVRKFGAVVVEMAERAAQSRQQEAAREYMKSNHAAHVREARKHQAEGCKAPHVGAFVFGAHSGLKDCNGITDEFDAFAAHPEWFDVRTDYDAEKRRREPLYKVMEIIEVTAEEFADPATASRLVKEAREKGEKFAGGARTDDPDRHDSRDEYRYFYTEVAAVVCGSRWYLIDSEGYDYARYIILPMNFYEMFAAEICDAIAREEARKAEEARREAEEKAARFAEYQRKCDKYAGRMEDVRPLYDAVNNARMAESEAGRAHGYRSPEYKAAGKATRAAEAALMAAQKRNIKAMAETIYPGIKCKVTKGDSWKGGFKLTYQDGPTLEEFIKNTDFEIFAEYWEEFEMDDSTTYHREEFTDFAEKYLADCHASVEAAREWSETTKARMTAAILETVPAAAGICWENRHPWTEDEVKAAAAAVGVDGWELWKEYDQRHSYFNFVDAEDIAEWAFNMIAFNIDAPKPKKSRRASAQAAESVTTKTETADTVTEGESEPQTADETPAPTSSDTEGGRLTMEQYSEKATVIRGYNAQQAAELEAMGGKEWRRLKGGKGYIFSTRRHGEKLAEWFEAQQAGETAQAAAEPEPEPQTADTLEGNGEISALFVAVADFFGTVARIAQEAAKWEAVTIPAATLARWKAETEAGTKQTAERFAEVCACLASLTPENREKFDALGVIFWTLSEQLRNGTSADTLAPAVEFARAQLFDLIDATQSGNQARAVREAFDSFRVAA